MVATLVTALGAAAGAGLHQRSSQQGAREAREEGDRVIKGQT